MILVEVERSKTVVSTEFSRAKPFVVAGIPAYNEENSIARVIIGAQKFADAVVVCDDGSTDLTAAIAERLGADVVRHEHNQGYGAALKSLFDRARELDVDVLVTLDADGQHDAGEIPNIVKPIIENAADIVIGSRFVDDNGTKEMPLHRQIGAKLITKIVNGSSKNNISDAQSGFRAYNHKAIEGFNIHETGMGASIAILLEAHKYNLRLYEVPSTCRYENADVETSSANPVSHGLSVLLSFVRIILNEKPLLSIGLPGFMCLFAGIAFGLWTMQIYAVGHSIPMGPAIAAMLFLLTSFSMLSTAMTLYAISRLAKRIVRK